MTHKLCLSAAAFLALLLALPAPALAYDSATPDQPNRLSAGLSHTAYVDEDGPSGPGAATRRASWGPRPRRRTWTGRETR